MALVGCVAPLSLRPAAAASADAPLWKSDSLDSLTSPIPLLRRYTNAVRYRRTSSSFLEQCHAAVPAHTHAHSKPSTPPRPPAPSSTPQGKSTLLNRLAGATVLAEDKLFATLDPTSRRVVLPNGKDLLLTDTVGFIQALPTQLVASFRATLEEVAEASLILHVVDASHPNWKSQMTAVHNVSRLFLSSIASRPTACTPLLLLRASPLCARCVQPHDATVFSAMKRCWRRWTCCATFR